jgi:hypothetical protein
MDAPIPFLPSQASDEKLSGAGGVTLNLWVDSKGALRRRPGLRAATGLYSGVISSAGISGIHVTLSGAVYAVEAGSSARGIFRVGSGFSRVSGTYDRSLDGGKVPTFAETEMLLVIAAGGFPEKVVLSTDDVSRLAGYPPRTSHIIANGLRLLANDVYVDRTKVRYSSQSIGTLSYSGHEEWLPGSATSAGFFTAEARPDPVVALHENTSEVFVFGSTNLQVFGQDGQLIYAPTNTREYGCIAPYSVVRVDQSFAWLDDKRRFVLSDGRSFSVISDPIKQDLDAMSVVSDCFGYRVLLGSLDAFVWTFPTDGRTFVYQTSVGWSQWSGQTSDALAPFPVLCHDFMGSENVVGLSSGKVAQLSLEENRDLGDNIYCSATTGFLDRGTSLRKHCRAAHFALRLDSTLDAECMVQWRDYEGPWGNPVRVALNRDQPVVSLRSLGVYRKREWRFIFKGRGDFALADAREEFDLLSS